MSQSLAKVFLHVIFSTKGRIPCLSPSIREDLYPYMGGTLKNLDSPALVIGGTANHMHVLCTLSLLLASRQT